MGGGYKAQPQGLDAFVTEMRKLNRQLSAVRRRLAALGLRVDGETGDLIFGTGTGDVRIQDGSDLLLDGGDLVVSDGAVQSGNFDHGAAGYRLKEDGTAEFNNLILRGGIIGNDALASPVSPGFGFDTGAGYALPKITDYAHATGGGTVRATVTLDVPDGYSRALIFAVAQDSGVNDTGTDDFLNSYLSVGSSNWEYAPSATVAAGKVGMSIAICLAMLTGLGSTVVSKSMPGTTAAGWSSSAANGTSLRVQALFLR